MPEKFESREALGEKIEWEGGIEEALEYGIQASEMPDPELEAAWEQMERAWAEFRTTRNKVSGLLPDFWI